VTEIAYRTDAACRDETASESSSSQIEGRFIRR